MDSHLEEYKFNYKHKMSDFSSINLKEMQNFSYDRQVGRDKVGYLKELNKFFKKKKRNELEALHEIDLPVSKIHSISETKRETSHIQGKIKSIQKLAENLMYERFMKIS